MHIGPFLDFGLEIRRWPMLLKLLAVPEIFSRCAIIHGWRLIYWIVRLYWIYYGWTVLLFWPYHLYYCVSAIWWVLTCSICITSCCCWWVKLLKLYLDYWWPLFFIISINININIIIIITININIIIVILSVCCCCIRLFIGSYFVPAANIL